MRGKAAFARLDDLRDGITPAYAGKSKFRKHTLAEAGDHPRVCGEKPDVVKMQSMHKGSPPRMRGKD